MSNEDGLPIGYYKVRGVEGSVRRGLSANNNNQVYVDLEVVEGDFASTVVTSIMPWTEASKDFTSDRLKALGWNGKFNAQGQPVGIGDRTVSMEAKLDSFKKDNGEIGETKKYEIRTGGGRVGPKQDLSPAQDRDMMKDMEEVFARSATGAPRSSSPNGKTGYDADWENKGAGNGGPAPKVKVDL